MENTFIFCDENILNFIDEDLILNRSRTIEWFGTSCIIVELASDTPIMMLDPYLHESGKFEFWWAVEPLGNKCGLDNLDVNEAKKIGIFKYIEREVNLTKTYNIGLIIFAHARDSGMTPIEYFNLFTNG